MVLLSWSCLFKASISLRREAVEVLLWVSSFSKSFCLALRDCSFCSWVFFNSARVFWRAWALACSCSRALVSSSNFSRRSEATPQAPLWLQQSLQAFVSPYSSICHRSQPIHFPSLVIIYL